METIGVNKRYTFVDYAKVIGMFLVIYAHLSPNTVWIKRWIYTFHMPLFFIISGWLSKGPQSLKTCLISQFKHLLVPAVFFTLLFVVFMCVPYHFGFFDLQSDAGISAKSNVFDTGLAIIQYDLGRFIHGGKILPVTMWFLFALFYCHILNWFRIKWGSWFYVICLLLLSTVFIHKLPFFISQGVLGYMFFFMGQQKELLLKLLSLKTPYYLVMVMISLTILCFNYGIDIFKLKMGVLPAPFNLVLMFVNGVLGSVLMLRVCMLFKKNSFVEKLSKSLITCLGMQFVFIYAYKHTIHYGQNILVSLLATVVIMMACYLMHVVFVRICPSLLGVKGKQIKTQSHNNRVI